MTYLVSTKGAKTYLTGKDAGLGQSDYIVLVGWQANNVSRMQTVLLTLIPAL